MNKILHEPDANGYSFADGLETIRSQQDGAMGRFRRDQLNSAVDLNVQWTCDVDQFEALRANYSTHVDEGHAPFPIDLLIDTASLVEFQVRMKPGSFKLMSVEGITFTVGVILEVPLPPVTTVTGDLPKMTLAPDQTGYSFTDTAQAILQALDGGPGRVRRDQIGASTIVEVQWLTTAAGYLYLRSYYRTWTTNPVGFKIDLLKETGALSEETCNFMPGTMSLQSKAGDLYIVKAQLEVLVAPDEAAACDCSMIAWSINFEPDGPVRGGVTENIAEINFEFIRDPLYGTGSRWWGTGENDEIYLDVPAVTIDGDWTFYYSFLAFWDPEQTGNGPLHGEGNWEMLNIFNADGTEYVRTWVAAYDDAGTEKFSMSLFYIPSFSQHEVTGFEYNVRYDMCHVMGGGRFRTFRNGVLIDDQSATSAGIQAADIMFNNSSTLSQPITIDEIHVVNVAEHDTDYTVDLPRCTCPLDPVDIGWYGDPRVPGETSPAVENFGHDDGTGSLGELDFSFALLEGPYRSVTTFGWTPVLPGDPPPIITYTGGLSFKITPQYDPDLNRMYDGVVHIGGDGVNGDLILTIYHNDDTTGYGGVSWAHS
jgi:hypothetical protein